MNTVEIYRDKPAMVEFNVPSDIEQAQMAYSVIDAAGEVRANGDAETLDEAPHRRFGFEMPYTLLEFDAEYTVEWDFAMNNKPLTRRTQVMVVTPMVNEEDVEDFDPAIERVVRKIIENYTGVTFGYSYRTRDVFGRGDKALILPDRLIELEHLSYTNYDFVEGFMATGDGWFLESNPDAQVSGYGHVIYPPDHSGKRYVFKEDRLYSIRGYWGYAYLPPQVHDAAVMLYNDFACMDAKYRARYIKSIYFAGSRMEFRDGAYTGTGNKIVDDLLAEYVRPTEMLI